MCNGYVIVDCYMVTHLWKFGCTRVDYPRVAVGRAALSERRCDGYSAFLL
jgi:hypothetical protein